jgi:hypothetical protein
MKHLTQFAQSRLALVLVIAVAVVFGAPVAAFAAAVGTLAQLDAALQITYNEPFINQITQDSDLLDLFELDSNIKEDNIGAKYAETSHWMRQAGAVGSRLEDEYLLESLGAQYLNSRIYLKKTSVIFELTGDEMRRMKQGNDAWVDYADQQMTGLAERTRDHMDRQMMLYGYGFRAQVSGTPTLISTGVYDIVIKNWGGISGAVNPWLLFQENDSINFTDGSPLAFPIVVRQGSATDKKAVVTDIDEDTSTIRVEMTAALAATLQSDDYIAEGDNRGTSFPSGSGGTLIERDFMGLTGHIDDGTYINPYFNVSRTANRRFKCINVDAATKGTADGRFTELTIDYGDQVAAQRSRAKINTIVCSTESNTQYWASLASDRTFNDPRSYTGGKPKGLAIMLGDRQVELRVLRKLTANLAFGLETGTFVMFGQKQLEWDSTSGSLWNRYVDSTGPKDRFYATAFCYRALWNHFVRKNIRWTNLTA